MSYQTFIDGKEEKTINSGFTPNEAFYPKGIKDHQRVSVTWACKRGRAALFFDTGLGKTLAQLTWAEQVCLFTNKSSFSLIKKLLDFEFQCCKP